MGNAAPPRLKRGNAVLTAPRNGIVVGAQTIGLFSQVVLAFVSN